MARDGSGNYTLPLPDVITGTTIESSWANTTLGDIETAMTDSLSRSGTGGMLAQLSLLDGTSAQPGFGFNSEANTGFYRSGANDMRVTVDGSDVMRFVSGKVQLWEDSTWKDIVSYPNGTTNNETLRYDTGTSEWVSNPNFTVTSAGAGTFASTITGFNLNLQAGIDAVGDIDSDGNVIARTKVLTDEIDEVTTDNGVDVDGTLMKDGWVVPGFGVRKVSNAGYLELSGSTAADTGANLRLFGEAATGNEYDVQFRSATTVELEFDASQNEWDFQIGNNVLAGEFVAKSNFGGLVNWTSDNGTVISGGVSNTSGASATFYGPTAPGQANDIIIRSGANTELFYDDTASDWDFSLNSITVGGDLNVSNGNINADTSVAVSGDTSGTAMNLISYTSGVGSLIDIGDTGVHEARLRIYSSNNIATLARKVQFGTGADPVGDFEVNTDGDFSITNMNGGNTGPLFINAGTLTTDDPAAGGWGPTIRDDTNSDGEGQAYTTNTGRHTWIGEGVVHFNLIIVWTSLGTLSGDLRITLPYSLDGTYSSVYPVYATGLNVTAGTSVIAKADANNNYMKLYTYDATGGCTPLQASECTTSGTFTISGILNTTPL